MRRKRFGFLIAATVALQVLVVPVHADVSSDLETCFIESINSERTSRGLDPLEVDGNLTWYARQHTEAMIDAGDLFHSTSSQLSAVLPDGWTRWGENVGYAASCENLHSALMGSPGHRANILNEAFTRMTIGAVVGSRSVWVTQVFYAHPSSLGLPPFWDDNGSVHEVNIVKLYEHGVSGGCDEGRFCPDDPLTRGQMAAFLVRALDLPAAPVDFFTDDNGSYFEDEINSIAAAGITSGCAVGQYCADAALTRGQMAAFLTRAFGFGSSEVDFFTDDSGHRFENEINALAAAGVTTGCSTGRYCPAETVTRGQMASFLVRGLGW